MIYIITLRILNSLLYTDEFSRNSLEPDFRHTLYWNPDVESKEVTFYASDLNGEYKVVVEGITKQGKVVYGSAEFSVGED